MIPTAASAASESWFVTNSVFVDRDSPASDRLPREDPPKECAICGGRSETPFADIGRDETIRLDLLPARPDLFDCGGLARALLGYLGIRTGLPEYPVEPGEVVVRVDYCGRPCQARIDWLSPDPEVGIVDLKTCSDLTWFEHDARKWGYAHQLAFYRAQLEIVTGDLRPVHIVAVEKREPFRCGVWRIAPDVLAIAEKENEESIQLLQKCRATDYWPTGYEETRTLDWI